MPFILASTVALCSHVLTMDPAAIADLPFGFVRVWRLPWAAILLPGLVFINRELTTNQFGWDGAGIEALLRLPIPAAELLRGKLSGLVRLHAAQLLPAALPLVALDWPRAPGLVFGLAAAAAALVAMTALGHLLSATFPHPVHVNAVPIARLAETFATSTVIIGLVVIYSLGSSLGRWGPAGLMLVLLRATAATYATALPALARRVIALRDRLVEELA